MMIPGEPEDWVMLDIEAGSTYLPEHVIRYCAQAQADGPDGTLVKIVHMIWAAGILETINGRIAERGRQVYRALIYETPELLQFFRESTPIDVLGQLTPA
mgnify:CR=1 FL=1